MTQTRDFKAAFLSAPPEIHVFKKTEGVTILTRKDWDMQYLQKQYSEGYVSGNGNKECPYAYRSAANVSPYYAIVDLWFRYRDEALMRDVYIQTNSWILQVTFDGVTTEDGYNTRLSL